MYQPKYFQMEDREFIAQFIEQNSFGVLCCSPGQGSPQASHLLMELVKNETSWELLGHMARANPLWRSFAEAPCPSLAIFSGPHHYISPSWYDHPNVPTWNYSAVHCAGRVELVEDAADILAMLKRAIQKYEKPDSGYSLDQIPEKILAAQLGSIVAFRLRIDIIDAGFKFSQNRDKKNFSAIIENLKSLGQSQALETVAMMEKFQKTD